MKINLYCPDNDDLVEHCWRTFLEVESLLGSVKTKTKEAAFKEKIQAGLFENQEFKDNKITKIFICYETILKDNNGLTFNKARKSVRIASQYLLYSDKSRMKSEIDWLRQQTTMGKIKIYSESSTYLFGKALNRELFIKRYK